LTPAVPTLCFAADCLPVSVCACVVPAAVGDELYFWATAVVRPLGRTNHRARRSSSSAELGRSLSGPCLWLDCWDGRLDGMESAAPAWSLVVRSVCTCSTMIWSLAPHLAPGQSVQPPSEWRRLLPTRRRWGEMGLMWGDRGTNGRVLLAHFTFERSCSAF